MNQLTPKQLDKIKRLQPVFKKKMGDRKIGDDVFQESFGCGFITNITSKRSTIIIKIYYPIIDSCLVYAEETVNDFTFRIPKPIDLQNPERGLWEMVLGVKELKQNALGCGLVVTTESYQRKYWDNNYNPFTALLQALVEQEGV